MHFKSLNLGVPEKQPLWLTSEVSSRLNRTYRSLRLLFATSAAAKLKLQLSFTSLAKATSSALSLKSPSKMEPTIVRPRPAKQDCSLLVCDFSFESVDETLWCYHSNETSSAMLSRGAIHLIRSSNFCVCG